ncbi:MAG: hypothetical protein M3315_05775 [Actinomycetota bacterium]|nr:hypothetical protein [Actinomycetota bacterium]
MAPDEAPTGAETAAGVAHGAAQEAAAFIVGLVVWRSWFGFLNIYQYGRTSNRG